MDFDIVSYIVTGIQMAVLCVLISLVAKKLKSKGSSVVLGFCMYALVCILLNDLYWLSLTVLKPDIRIPYGAGDVADSGVFLLFAAMIGVVYAEESPIPKRNRYGIETVLVTGFSIAVIILWIGWTDEWFKNIVGGIPFGFFMWKVVIAVKKTGALSKIQAVLLGVMSYGVISVMTVSRITSGEMQKMLDIIGNTILVTGIVLLLSLLLTVCIKYYRQAPKERTVFECKKLLAISFLAIIWTLNATYMCVDPLYSIEDMIYTGLLAIMTVHLLEVSDKLKKQR